MRPTMWMTRRAAALFSCCSLLLIFAAGASADAGPHVQGQPLLTDSCALCHRAHTARAPHLLTEPETELCFTCHGSAAAGASTDVLDGVGYESAKRSGKPAALRGGGFKYALIDSASPSGQSAGGSDPDGVVPVLSEQAPVTSGHSIDGSSQMNWGNGPISAEPNYGNTISLSCGSCHDPHGNGNYRILRPIPLESGAETGVTIPEAPIKEYTTTNYWDVEEPNDPAFLKNISAWCATCHTRFLSSTSFTESGDAIFTDRHISAQTTQGSANCIQCHVAHGSNAAFEAGVSTDVHSPTPVGTGLGSSLLRVDDRGTCRMCHAGEE